MRLSDYKNTDAIDLLADLIEPIADLVTKEEIQAAVKANKPTVIIARDCLKYGKKEVLEILATIDGVPVDKYECTPISILRDLLVLLNDPDIQNFFTGSQMEILSGASPSVPGNIAAAER